MATEKANGCELARDAWQEGLQIASAACGLLYYWGLQHTTRCLTGPLPLRHGVEMGASVSSLLYAQATVVVKVLDQGLCQLVLRTWIQESKTEACPSQLTRTFKGELGNQLPVEVRRVCTCLGKFRRDAWILLQRLPRRLANCFRRGRSATRNCVELPATRCLPEPLPILCAEWRWLHSTVNRSTFRLSCQMRELQSATRIRGCPNPLSRLACQRSAEMSPGCPPCKSC